ncbi:MAG: PEP/pyruvate-binding domain-containing protein, partial [Candidatus Methanofastidiosia archaeon]
MCAKFVKWFEELGIEDVPLVGGKNASLGEMIQHLSHSGVSVPDGFAITAESYRYILKKSGVEETIKQMLSDLDTHNIKDLQERGKKVRKIIMESEIPKDLEEEILLYYHQMPQKFGYDKNTDVAVRSSATAEDLPDASFAGQQETYLNIRGDKKLIEACKKCFASL